MTTRENLNARIDMAAGRKLADLLLTNCKIVDVYNQQIVEGSLAIGHGKIIGYGYDYEAKETIDVQGNYVMPGLIDGHVHIESSSLIPTQFARCILPFGTTTIIADPHEIANVSGIKGIRYMLEASRRTPLDVRIMLPSCVPATPNEQSGYVLEASDLEALIHEQGIHGLGEVMDYPSVITHAENMMDKLWLAKKHNRVIDGHSPGVHGKDLVAYVMGGIMTDHECSTPAEMLERMRLGQYILLREGSTCKDLLNLIPAITSANARRCVLCTDDREASDILDSGHINESLRLAVTHGLDPLLAITLATLNAAECFTLKGKGAIAPDYDADLLIVEDLQSFTPTHVFVAGKEIARDGKLLVDWDDYISDDVINTVNLPTLTEDSFTIPLATEHVHVIGVNPKSVLTSHLKMHVKKDEQGNFTSQNNQELNKLAVIERHHATGSIGLGILANYGLKNGAIAVTVAHDSHNLVVVGDNDRDMLVAVKDVELMGGGISLCQEGKILAHLPLPVAGLMSDKPAQQVAHGLHTLIDVAKNSFGINPEAHPLMTLVFMTLPVIPEIKLTSTGLFDVALFQPIDLCTQ